MKFQFNLSGIAFLIGFSATILGYASVDPLILTLLFLLSDTTPVKIYTK